MPVEHANNVVHVSPEARLRYGDCLEAIKAAYTWAQGVDLVVGLASGEQSPNEAQEIVRKREVQAAEMERSLLANVARLVFTPASDGLLTFHSDPAPLSFFWRYESGYHGGLIYHASYASEGTERLPVGTWSVHT